MNVGVMTEGEDEHALHTCEAVKERELEKWRTTMHPRRTTILLDGTTHK